MSTSILPQPGPGLPSGAVRDDLSEAPKQEIDALRAALDTRLVALEAALADPYHCGSLEALVLDLARVATEEAAASTHRAIVDAQVETQARAANGWMEVQTSLATERSASIALRHELAHVQAALQAERAAGAALRRDLEDEESAAEAARADGATERHRLDEANATLDRERADSAALRQTLEQAEGRIADAEHQIAEAEQRIEVVETEKLAEVRGVHEQFASELLLERAAVVRLTDTVTDLRAELAAALKNVGSRTAEIEVARGRADALEEQRKEVDQVRRAAEARYDEAILERDLLARELEEARQEASAASAAARARLDALENDRQSLERACENSDARLEMAILDRDAVARELEAARQETVTTSAAARARLDALEDDRQSLERACENSDARLEMAIFERDAVARELEAARQETSAASAAARAHADALDADRANLEQARQGAETRLEMAARDREALTAELVSLRDALRAAQEEAHSRHEQQMSAVERSNLADVRAVHEQFASELSQERAAAVRLMETLEQRERELAVALDNAAVRAAEVDAARQLADALDWQRNELERAGKEAAARYDAAILERETLSRELEGARQEAGATSAAARSRADALDADRANLEQARQRAETRLEMVTRDCEALTAELESLTAELESVREAVSPARKGARARDEQPPATSDREVQPRADRPLRRARRQTFHEEIQIQIDARPGLLVDLSKHGAQVLSPTTLKPNRVVKIQWPSGDGTVTCRGKIVWARLEPSDGGSSLRYRAGVCFTTADETAVVAFMAARAPGPQGT